MEMKGVSRDGGAKKLMVHKLKSIVCENNNIATR